MADAPEVDGLVFLDKEIDKEIDKILHKEPAAEGSLIDQTMGLNPGDFVDVKIIDNSEHDLWAELL